MEYLQCPCAFIGLESHIQFTEALIFCQDENIDVLEFMLNGLEYIAVFSVDGYGNLISF